MLLLFDRKPANEMPWKRELWIYDLHTNQNLTLKTNPPTLRTWTTSCLAITSASRRNGRSPNGSGDSPTKNCLSTTRPTCASSNPATRA